MIALIAGVLVLSTAVLANPHGYYGGGGHNHGGGSYYGGGGNYYGTGGHNHGGSGAGGRPAEDCGVKPDNRTLAELYKRALAEGGKLVVYAGGDAPNQQDSTRAGFEKAFPGIRAEIIVDFSKNHDARIDYQLQTDTVVFDIAQLQTVQDFPRWKKEGVLLDYKPIGWDHIDARVKDSEGSYTGVFMDTFSTTVNVQLLPNNATWPVEANDYLKPEFKNKLVVTYPNDDDAVLFWFYQVVQKYGMQYLTKFKAQNPTFVRGTQAATDMVADTSKGFVATMSADGGLGATNDPRLVLPKKDPFVIWAQQAAIFKKAKHPETAKLYMSWLVDKKEQEGQWSFSVRDDVTPPAPYKMPWSYAGQSSHTAFLDFMSDRVKVEQFKTQITLIFGAVQGPNPNGDLGMYPVTGYRPPTTTTQG